MSLENIDYILFTDNQERAEAALERYLEERKGKQDASRDYRYFVLEEEDLTIIEDIRIGEKTIYNQISFCGEEVEIERNKEYEEVEKLLPTH